MWKLLKPIAAKQGSVLCIEEKKSDKVQNALMCQEGEDKMK